MKSIERRKRRKNRKKTVTLPREEETTTRHIVVLVLGDVGRSPRMQYHAVSLSKCPNTKVSLVGYGGEKCIDQVIDSPSIDIITFKPFTKKISRAFFLFYAPFKVLFQILQLLWILGWTISSPVDLFLVQNPPSYGYILLYDIQLN